MAKSIRFEVNSKGFQELLLRPEVFNLCGRSAEAIASSAETKASGTVFKAEKGVRSTKRAHYFVRPKTRASIEAIQKYNVLEKSIDAGRFK